MSEPREWLICGDDVGSGPRLDSQERVKVIEKSAYDALAAELEQVRAELRAAKKDIEWLNKENDMWYTKSHHRTKK